MVLQALGNFVSGLFGGSGGVASSAAGWIASREGAKQQQKYNLESMKQAQKYNTANMKTQQDYNLKAMKYSFDLSKQLEQLNNEWSAQMSNTAHQREVEDLKKAGLNPILSANNGASTPGASGATISPLGGSALGSSALGINAPDYNSAFQNAMQYQGVRNQTNLTEGQVVDLKAGANLKNQQANTQSKQQELLEKQAEYVEEQKNCLISSTAADVKYKADQGEAAKLNAVANEKNATAHQADIDYKKQADWYEKSNLHPLYNTGKQIYKDVKNSIKSFEGSVKPPKTGNFTISIPKKKKGK